MTALTKAIVGLLMLSFVVATCGGSNNTGAVSPTVKPTATPTLAPSVPAGQDVVGVGEGLTWDGEVTVWLLNAQVFVTDSDYFDPDAGNKFVSVLVEVEALVDGMSYSTFSFSVSDSQSFTYNGTFIGGKEPELGSSSVLLAGRKAKGWLTFEVPKGEYEFILIMNDYPNYGEWHFTVGD